MKLKHILIAILTLCLLLTVTACGGGNTPAETTAGNEVTTETPTEAATEAPTEVPTEAPTEAPTEELTEAPGDAVKKYREDWEDDDPENPYTHLIKVGTGYDGKVDCYDGRYDFGYDVCQTDDGLYFSSVQEAIYYLEGYGGSIHMREDTNICLYLDIPADGCDYRVYYEFKNVDFVFNYGNIYDDCTPNENDIIGYAYYSDITVLDNISGLENTQIWLVTPSWDFTEAGRYKMLEGIMEGNEFTYSYTYTKEGDIAEWPGLPKGEYLPGEDVPDLEW